MYFAVVVTTLTQPPLVVLVGPCAVIFKLLAQGGREAIVRDVAKRYGSDVLDEVEALLAHDMAAGKKPAPKPPWLDASKVPVLLRASGRRLPQTAIDALVAFLSLCEPREAHDALEEVAAACTPDSLARSFVSRCSRV